MLDGKDRPWNCDLIATLNFRATQWTEKWTRETGLSYSSKCIHAFIDPSIYILAFAITCGYVIADNLAVEGLKAEELLHSVIVLL